MTHAHDPTHVAVAAAGQATVELTPFRRVVGVDPSARMIEQARESLKTRLAGLDLSSQVEFVQSSAEDLGFLKEGSADLIVAGTRMPISSPVSSVSARRSLAIGYYELTADMGRDSTSSALVQVGQVLARSGPRVAERRDVCGLGACMFSAMSY